MNRRDRLNHQPFIKRPKLTLKDNKKILNGRISSYWDEYSKNLIQNRIQKVSDSKFTTVLLNQYRDGKDSNGWHADNEKELGENPVIASISFGAERFFHLKHRNKKDLRMKIPLTSGSLLFMEGETQKYWLHQIAKTSRKVGPRINLTFRKII